MQVRKVNEFRVAFKKFVSRLMILTAIVVFGAIAIAQAQKDATTTEADESENTANQPDQFLGEAKPIPNMTQDEAIAPAAFNESDGLLPNGQHDDETVSDTLGDEHTDQEIFDDDYVDTANFDDTETFDDAQPIDDTGSFEDNTDQGTFNDESNLELEDPSDLSANELPSDLPPLGNDDLDSTAGRNPYRDNNATDLDLEIPNDTNTDVALDSDTLESDDDLPPLLDDADDSVGLDPIDDVSEFDDLNTQEELYQDDDTASHDDLLSDDLNADAASHDVQEGQSEDFSDKGLQYYSEPNEQSINEEGANSEFRNPANKSRFSNVRDNSANLARANAGNHSDVRSTGLPGPQSLEGPQTPSLSIEKIAPSEVQVGKPAQFRIRVRNVGQIPADNVIVRDEIPEGTNFIDSSPAASDSAEGGLVWEIGTINPGDETIVTIELMPIAEGQVGSVATVSMQASATARARSTKPALTLEHTAPRSVLVGDQVKFTIKISNPGSGTATQVVLEEDVPEGLSHASGPRLEYEVGSIRPGQTRHLELTLKAAEAGKVINRLIAKGDGGLIAEDRVELEVTAPKLQVGVTGPKRRYLNREATFTVSVANPGTASAKNVELVAQLPPGLKFLSTNNSGHFDQVRRAIVWSLEQLPAGEMGRAQFKAVPTEMGEFQIRAEGKADRGLVANRDHMIAVEGIAALYFGVADQTDPIEVGGSTTYVITVENQGSKTATNVQIVAQVPVGMKPVRGDGATSAAIRGQNVIFEPIPRLQPKSKTSFRVTVQGSKSGDHKLRVEMKSDDIPSVIKEESTRVYSDSQ